MKPHEVLNKYKSHPDFSAIKGLYLELLKEKKTAKEIESFLEKQVKKTKTLTMRLSGVPVTILLPNDGAMDGKAINQISIASKLPNALLGALLPDGHPGYALPIGGVIALDNAVSPSAIGYDISCMMYLTVFNTPVDDFKNNIENLFEILKGVTSFGLGSNFKDGKREHKVMESAFWNEIAPAKKLKDLAQNQLGSSGGGNHFADLMLITFNDKHKAYSGTYPALLTHSGSRGTGHRLATHYSKLAEEQTKLIASGIPSDYAWLDLNSQAGSEYWHVMTLMGDYALANHQLIHNHFVKESKLDELFIHHNKHNFAWKEHIIVKGEKVTGIVHRKGATPLHKGNLGVIPGTCGTTSYYVEGLGNVDTMDSASHGAGRPRSRSASKKIFDKEGFEKHMSDRGIIYSGIDGDENPLAYKDIEDVIGAQEGKLFDTVATLEPLAVLMGGKSDDGD